ncbi:MAG: binding-protein-dependent transport system inner rane component [Marmoricola sp.]|jgi:peptide/nickel transport system permease protein|nr:binding-protein-dependent transport system inner rane component [Marmoricola sp.]
MYAYVARRMITGVLMLILMSMITFVLFFASPVDPGRFACGKNCSPALIKQVDKAFGYDKSVVVQWKDFAVGVFKGRQYPEDPSLRKSAPELVSDCHAPCLGYSQVNLINVTTELKDKIPISGSIAVAAFLMWIIGGVGLGTIAALTKGSLIDRGLVGTSLVFYAFPTFWIGLFLLEFPAIKWGLVPIPNYISIADGGLWGWASNLFLPALTLALFYMAGYVRMTRAFVLESMSEDYLRTAKSKGLAPRKVLFKHTMRAALTPIVTMAGLDLASVLGGAVITETVFNYNGLGKLAVDSIATFDLPTVVGLVLLLAAFVIVANIVVDILYAFIDPRVRLG